MAQPTPSWNKFWRRCHCCDATLNDNFGRCSCCFILGTLMCDLRIIQRLCAPDNGGFQCAEGLNWWRYLVWWLLYRLLAEGWNSDKFVQTTRWFTACIIPMQDGWDVSWPVLKQRWSTNQLYWQADTGGRVEVANLHKSRNNLSSTQLPINNRRDPFVKFAHLKRLLLRSFA